MKERPILFSGPMVRAILEDRKTQTRRVVKPQWADNIVPKEHSEVAGYWIPYTSDRRLANSQPGGKKDDCGIHCPYGAPGDRLWVKETFYAYGRWIKDAQGHWHFERIFHHTTMPEIFYAATETPERVCTKKNEVGWFKRPAIFMERWMSRLPLENKSVRVERLQDITEEDAFAEGIVTGKPYECGDAKDVFKALWNSISGAKYPWDSNPWLWVIDFERVTP